MQSVGGLFPNGLSALKPRVMSTLADKAEK